MSLIKPRTRGRRFVRHITRLDTENNETLYAYAAFLDESPEYVLNQAIDILAKDRDFLAWRADHPQSYVTRPASRTRIIGRRAGPVPRPLGTEMTGAARANSAASHTS